MQQSGGSGPAGAGAGAAQYGVPDVSQFVSGNGGRPPLLGISPHEQLQQQQQQSRPGEIQSPISHRTVQPATTQQQQQQQNQNQNQQQQLQLVPSGAFGEHDEAVLAAEDGERGGPVGNRWPRQETLALLKIRSDMDAAFRDASLKGPLWDEVSRKLAELGYQRSSKKCKEKFENVQKYYKRTKDGRAGRQDGKCYRFFSQLEALHNNSSSNNINNSSSNNMNTGTSSVAANNNSAMNPRTGASNALPMSAALPAARPLQISAPPILSGGISNNNASAVDLNPSAPEIKSSMFYRSSNLSSTSESSEEDYEEQTDSRKRKRGGSGGTAKKMMFFFEQLIKQVMERQETMQQKFLEAIEKREHDRMIREEAWKRQEMARLNREHEIMAQERSLAASRDAAFIAFLQKITGQSIQIPLVPPVAQSTTTVNTVPAMNDTREATTSAIQLHSHHQQQHQPPQQHQQQQHEIMNAEQTDLSSFDHGSSRWPKSEVHALIKLRSAMESRYQDAGPKGPLWEEISNGMARLGYSRSSKRCKEKWENINKYFKKVKESNKKRPEDAKTCPYFHQLDQLYKKKQFGNASNAAAASNQSNKNQPQQQQQQQLSLNQKEALVALPAPPANSNGGERADGGGGGGQIPHEILAIMPPPVSENQNSNGGNNASPATAAAATIPTSNGGLEATAGASSYYPSPDNGDGSKKQPQSQQQQQQQPESLNMNMMDVMVDMDAIQNEQEQQQHQNHQHQHQQQPQPQQQQQQPQPPPSVEDYDSDKMDADDDEDEDDEGDDSDNSSADQEQSQHHSHRPAIPAAAAANSHDHIPFAQFVHEPRNPAPTAAATAASTFMAMVHRMASSGAAAAGGPEAAEFKSSKT